MQCPIVVLRLALGYDLFDASSGADKTVMPKEIRQATFIVDERECFGVQKMVPTYTTVLYLFFIERINQQTNNDIEILRRIE